MKIILIDNFDSFTYNIVQAFQCLGQNIVVVRNKISVQELLSLRPDLLIIGPGPGNPSQAGISKECISLNIPIFGICLGHQVIGEVFGAKVVRAKHALHGKTSAIYHNGRGIFHNLPQGFAATRYHSLVIEPQTLPSSLQISAWTQEQEIMGICHKDLPIAGVQFHPESIASEEGMHLLQNALY